MAFLDEIKQGALENWHNHKILPSITASQGALESGWGKSKLALPPNYNLFGIKASSDWSGKTVSMSTQEYGSNGSYMTTASFRVYDSWNHSVSQHGAFFTNTAWREENYKHVVGETSYEKAAKALQSAGYATDPGYANKLIKLIEEHKLYEWDKEALEGKPSTAKKVVGGSLTDSAKTANKQLDVTLIGDSLGVGTKPYLESVFKSFNSDVLGSRQITHATDSLNGTKILTNMKNAGTLKSIVVVILGTNRGVTDAEVDSFINIAGASRKVIFVDTNSAVNHKDSVASAYKKASDKHANAYYANWSTYSANLRSRYYGSDNIHMNSEGYRTHANFIQQAVYESTLKTTQTSTTTKAELIDISDIVYDQDGYVSVAGESAIYNTSANGNWYFKFNGESIYPSTILEIDSDDPQEIFEAGLQHLKDNAEPLAQYTINLADIPFELSIGDTGLFIDHNFNPPLYLQGRVLSITTSSTDTSRNQVVIGNTLEVRPADKTDILKIQKELKDTRDNLVDTYRQGKPIVLRIDASNGNILKEGLQETSLVVTAFKDDEDITENITRFEWTRDTTGIELDAEDEAYNNMLKETNTTASLNIKELDVTQQATFTVRAYIDNNLIAQNSAVVKNIMDPRYTHIVYADDEDGNGISTNPNGKDYVGISYNKRDSETSLNKNDYVFEPKINKVVEEVDQAIKEAEQAKKDAEKAYEDAVAEAEAKVQAKDKEYKAIFEEYDSTVESIEEDSQTAKTKAEQALTEAGISTDLAQTAKDLADTAKTNAQTALSNASTAMSNASQAIASANTAKTNAQTALDNAQSALTTAGNTKTTVNSLTTRVDEVEGEVELKASQTEVDGISGTVSTHTTTIGQHATAIASKAESSLVNTIKGTVDTHTTEISQNATDIASKASATSVNTLTGTVSDHTTKISQNATDISARLTSSQVNSLVDGKGLAKVTYVDNQINATADGFSSELTKVEGKIDGLQFGVENLVLDSKKLINVNNNNGTWGLVKANGFITSRKLEVGKTYTITVKSRFGGYIPQLEIWAQGTQQLIKIPYKEGTHVSANTFTCTYSADGLHIYGQYLAKDVSFIEWITIVEGNKAPGDWIPSTQDVLSQDEWTVWENNYTSTISGITTELSKTAKKTDLNGMVTESVLATKNFVTQGSINTTLSNYLKTTDLNGKIKETVAYQDIKETTDRYTRVIGSTDAESRTKIAQIALTDSLFQTTVQNSLGNTGNLVTNPDFEDGLNGWENLIGVESNDTNLPKKYYARQASRDVYNLRTFPVSEGQKYRISYYRWNATTFNNETSIGLLYKTKDGVSIWQKAVTENGALLKSQVSGVVAVPANVVTARLWVNIGQYENFSPLFFTQVSVELIPNDMAFSSQVTQLADSWALTLKSGNDIKTQINASTDGIRLQSKFIHLNGSSLIDDATIKSAKIENLNANKITGNTADFNTIRTGVLTANAVTSTHIKADTALFDTLFSTTSATSRLVAQGAWITNGNIISLNADKITAGTISANRISTSSLSNVDLNNENLIRNSAVPQNGYEWQNRPDATITRMADGYEHLMSATANVGNIFLGIGKNSLIPLEPNTDYVYSMWIFAGAYASVTATTPLHAWVASGGSNQGGVVDGTRVLLSNSYILANTWTRIVVRFKTTNANDIKFTPMWYGSMYPNGIAVRVRNLQLEKGLKATDWRPSPYDNPSESKLSRSGSVEIHGGNIKADTLDVGAITGDKASFFQTSWEGLNSSVTVDSSKVRLTNSAKDYIELNGIPEVRSQDSAGTAAIMGKGRSHYYSGNQARFYIGSNLEGLAQYGIHIAKGQTWGIYRNSDSYGGTPAQYHTVVKGEYWRSITTKYWNDSTSVDVLMRLNGYSVNNYPVLQPGDVLLIKPAVAGNSSGVETIMSMGTSTNGATRIYSHVHQVFAGGYSESSDRRLKHDIVPTQVEALNHITSLSFKEFKWNKDNRYEPLGIIAQDSGIIRVSDTEMEGINTTRAVMLGLKGIQELHAIVKEQAEEIKQLKEIINQ